MKKILEKLKNVLYLIVKLLYVKYKSIKKEINFILKNCEVDPSLYNFLPYIILTLSFIIITVSMFISV